ncbi:MAG: 4Fe-4S binding protein [Stenotrophobium sp.]
MSLRGFHRRRPAVARTAGPQPDRQDQGHAHQWQQAFATREEACHACGLCVTTCPEKAITLRRV